MRDETLMALARAPLLSADDLALLCGTGERVARRALGARVTAGETGYVMQPATRRHLYYLTAAGVVAAARIMDADPEELASRYALGERALLRRLPALDRLVAGRTVLLRLAAALARAGGALEDWHAYPVRWLFTRAGHREALILDGEATLRFADGVRCAIGYLWDGDAATPHRTLSARLDHLTEVQTCPAYTAPYPARVPPVLLVTADTARVPPGYRPGLLWTTIEALAASDPLSASWRSASSPAGDDEGRHLRAALDRLGLTRPWPTPAATAHVTTTLTAPRAPETVRRRAAQVQASPSPAHDTHDSRDLLVLPLVLPPRAWPLLRCVGEHPLLDRHDLATILERDPFDTWEVLRALCHHGLCQAWRPDRDGHAWRYSLTTRGTMLLALAAGLTPLAYRHSYGVLDDARRRGEHGLSYARTNLAHTDGITAAYLAFLAAARARGGCLWWRGEWACTRAYRAPDRYGRERLHTLRPDAELRYDGPGRPRRLHAFVEVDRGEESAQQLAGKVDRYYAYWTDSGAEGFAVLLVTPGPRRADRPLAHAREIARDQRVPLLDLRTTTAAALAAQGPWAPIWRDVRGALGAIDAR